MSLKLFKTSDVHWININQIATIRYDTAGYNIYLVDRHDPIRIEIKDEVYFSDFTSLIAKSQVPKVTMIT